jgi:hypothetical protein
VPGHGRARDTIPSVQSALLLKDEWGSTNSLPGPVDGPLAVLGALCLASECA